MAPRGKDFLKRQSSKEQERLLKKLYDSTTYRLNDQTCPFCRASGTKEIRIELNQDDFFECPQCHLVGQLVYEPNAINAFNILSWMGTNELKDGRDFDHLFKDLVVTYTAVGGRIHAVNSNKEIIALQDHGAP